jgi:hypothetical protein
MAGGLAEELDQQSDAASITSPCRVKAGRIDLAANEQESFDRGQLAELAFRGRQGTQGTHHGGATCRIQCIARSHAAGDQVPRIIGPG